MKTMDQIRVRQNLWLFSQGEGDDTLILTREEGKALWRSVVDDAHRRIEAEFMLKKVRDAISG